MLERNYSSFIGGSASYKDSKAVIYGAPFDSTCSYRPGTRFAPAAIRNESYGIETYSPYLDKDLEEIAFFDSGDVELPMGDTKKALSLIGKRTAKILADGKLPIMVGGEHLVTLAAVREVYKKYPELRIVHFDAHIDFRDEYLGVSLSHASVIRRSCELIGDGKIYQFGIRSGDKSEFRDASDRVFTEKFSLDGVKSLKDKLGDKPVYFTVDMDVLDSSVFPGTGTPEAGGVSFNELLNAAKTVGELNIVGADMVELSPPLDTSGASTAAACKFLRELLLDIVK